MVSSVGAADVDDNLTSSSDDVSVYHEDNPSKDIYVSPSGDDSNSGSSTSYLKTINASVSKFNASDNGVIHLSEGVFSGDGNNMININYAHTLYNGSLTFVGAGYNKTFIDGGIDGNASYKFFTLGADSRVTFINLTFVNGKDNLGGAITNNGNMTIDSCVFDSCVAPTYGGAIYIPKNARDTTIKNSTFINIVAEQGGVIYGYSNFSVSDSKFINCRAAKQSANPWGSSQGGIFYIDGANAVNIINCEFYNGSAQSYGVAYIRGGLVSNKVVAKFNITNNKFINCTATNSNNNLFFILNGLDIELKNNTFNSTGDNTVPFNIYSGSYANNVNLTFMDNQTVDINNANFTLNAKVTDDMGNIITGGQIYFTINGSSVGSHKVNNQGTASVSLIKLLDNGVYTVSGYYQCADNETLKLNTGTINFYIDRTPIDLYVSPEGDDENGTGTEDKPFKSLNKAIITGFADHVNVIVHMDNGTYLSANNTGLSVNDVGSLKIIGKSYNSTVIDAEDKNAGFITVGNHISLDISNITFMNSKISNPRYGSQKYGISSQQSSDSKTVISDCIFENCIDTMNVYSATINNILFINSSNARVFLSFINNSRFIDSPNKVALYLVTSNITNSEFLNNSHGAMVAYQGVVQHEGITFVVENCTFINSSGTNGSAIDYGRGTTQAGDRIGIINNCIFINSTATQYGGALALDDTIEYTITNNQFINSSANYGGVISIGDTHRLSNLANVTLSNNTMINSHADTEGNEIYIISGSVNAYVKFNDLTTTKISDNVTAQVSDDMGNSISGGIVSYYIDNVYIGQSHVVNGTSTFNFIGFTNGTYALSGNYSLGNKSSITSGTVTVGIEDTVNNVTYYVSPSGSDENGTGTLENPFRTIRHAYEEAVLRTTTVKIELLEGNFTGEGNINVPFSGYVNLTINGRGINVTYIDASPLSNLAQESFTISPGISDFVLSNLTFTNGVVKYNNINSTNYANNLVIPAGVTAYIENVCFTKNNGNGGGALSNFGTMTVVNCDFFNNGDAYNASAIDNYGKLDIVNSSFILNHAKLSTVSNNGNMTITSSVFIDDLRSGYMSYFSRIKNGGYADIRDTQFIVSGKNQTEILDIIGTNNLQYGLRNARDRDNPLCSNQFSNGNVMIFVNCTFTDNPGRVKYNGDKYSSMAWGSRGQILPLNGNMTVLNCTFNNIQELSINPVNVTVENSLFNNITSMSVTPGKAVCYLTFNDNVVLFNGSSSKPLTITASSYTGNLTYNFDNNWFGTNTPHFTSGNISKYLVLAVEPVSNGNLNQSFKFGFKVFDGENYTDYEGSIPARSFEFVTSDGIIDLTGNHNFDVNYVDGAAVNTVSGEGLSSVKEGTLTADSVGNKTFRLTVDNEILEYNTTVRKVSELDIDPKVVYVDNNTVLITLTDSEGNPITADISVLVNGTEYQVSVKDGKAEFTPDEFSTAGVYEIVLNYQGTEEYLPADLTDEVTVLFNSNIRFNIDNKGNVYVNLTDSEGNPVANATVRYTVDGTEGTLVTDNDGTGMISGLRGKHNLSFVYDGKDNYGPSKVSSDIYIASERINTTIESHDFSQTAVDFYNGERGADFVVILRDANGNPLVNKNVSIGFNGAVYSKTTDENGSARLQINLRTAGDYTFATAFLGDDDYAGSFVVNTIHISKKVSRLVLSGNSAVKVNAYRTLTISLQGQRALNHNKYITAANKTVSVTVNGRTYSVRIGANGKGTLRVRFTRAGTYTITTKFAGDGTYSAKTLTSKITVRR